MWCLNSSVKSAVFLIFAALLLSCGRLSEGRKICCGGNGHKVKVLPERPERFKDGFQEYKRFVESDGFVVAGLQGASLEALKRAGCTINHILCGCENIRKGLVEKGIYCVVSKNGKPGSVGKKCHPLPGGGVNREKVRNEKAIFCKVGDLPGFASSDSGKEVSLVRNLALSIYENILKWKGDFTCRLRRCYESAMERGLCKDTAAAESYKNYWAEGVQSWFDCRTGQSEPNGRDSFVNTREELKKYDPNLAGLISEVFGKNQWRYGKEREKGERRFTYLKKLREKTKELDSLQCELEYLFKQPLLDSKTLRKGTLYYQRLDDKSKLRISFRRIKQDEFEEEDYREDYIFDGVWLKHIDYQIKTVKLIQQAEPNEPVRAFDLAKRNFPIIGFSSTEQMQEEFEIKLSEEKEDYLKYDLKVKPGSVYEEDYREIGLWIDKGLTLPTKIEATTPEGDVYVVDFLKPVLNKQIGAEVFEVEIPEGFGEPEVIPLEKQRRSDCL